jgi:archaellum component FlaC
MKAFTTLLLVGAIAFLSVFLFEKFFKNTDKEVQDLLRKNEEIVKENKRLDSLSNTFHAELEKRDYLIENFNNQDRSLIEKVSTIDNQIKSLKTGYEKANNHADNFGSIDIQRYFADSLPR